MNAIAPPLPARSHAPADAPGAHAAIGRLCEKCDGKCPICDSYVRPATLVRVCDECNYGSYEGRCVICGGVGVSDAYYCKECTLQEKDVSGDGTIATLAVHCRELWDAACRQFEQQRVWECFSSAA